MLVSLIQELEQQFLSQNNMKDIGVIYLQFSMQLKVQHKFIAQLSTFKTHYIFGKQMVQNHNLSHPFLMEHYWSNDHLFSSLLYLSTTMQP
jgi:hypothetical protein